MSFNNFALLFNKAAEKGILLLIAGVLAVLCVNSDYAFLYHKILNSSLDFYFDRFYFHISIYHFINDFLMALFFFLVGLEIKRELIEGHLSTRQQRILPVVAACGGVLVPIIIYSLINYADSVKMYGWAIPCATDIAFALAIFAVFSRCLSPALRVFLAALAIIDDLIAVIIIALFYSNLNLDYIPLILIALTILIVMNRLNLHSILLYSLMGVVIWFLFYQSGIHSTVGGVILGLAIPLKGWKKERKGLSPTKKLEKILVPLTSFFILPLFTFANAGLVINEVENIFEPVIIAILLGLFIGKQIGVFGSSWLLFKLKLCKIPENSSLWQFYVVSILCGIGFTMSLFIATLSFANYEISLNYAKIGIIFGSLVSVIYAFIILMCKCRI